MINPATHSPALSHLEVSMDFREVTQCPEGLHLDKSAYYFLWKQQNFQQGAGSSRDLLQALYNFAKICLQL